jgi:hypothetical protein
LNDAVQLRNHIMSFFGPAGRIQVQQAHGGLLL